MKQNTKSSSVTLEAKAPKQKPRAKSHIGKIVAIAGYHVVGVAAIVGLSVALAYNQQAMVMQSQFQNQMEAAYSRSYYNLIDGTNDLDVKIRKLGAASSNEKQQSLLYEVWSCACVAESNLSTFVSNDEGLQKAEKFVNQLGDYCHCLALKLADGGSLTDAEHTTISKLGEMVSVLKRALTSVQGGLDEGRLFVSDGGVLGDFADSFKEFTSPSIEYPEMIYDGPFSDALETRKPKALKGADVNQSMGEAKVRQIFAERKLTNLEYAGETLGDIETLNFSFMLDGKSAFAQLSKRGGMLISLNVADTSAMQNSDMSKNKDKNHNNNIMPRDKSVSPKNGVMPKDNGVNPKNDFMPKDNGVNPKNGVLPKDKGGNPINEFIPKGKIVDPKDMVMPSGEAAMKFAKSLGYDNVEVIWTATANGMTYVNLAPIVNDTVIYPDLIKVKTDTASCEVIGFDAMHYVYNHTSRVMTKPTLSLSDATAKIKMPIVGKGRLALIPLQESKETLTYEFECEKNGTYFVYIDAVTGKEVNILFVIETPQGLELQ